MGVRDDALVAVKNAWRADPSNIALAYLLVHLATPRWVEDKSLNVSASADAVTQMLGAWPDNPVLHGILGEIYVIGKDYPEAAREFKKGMELSPDHPYYSTQLAYVYDRAGSHDQALDIARLLIGKDPENPNYYFVLGSVYANAGVCLEAIEHFRRGDDLLQSGHPVPDRNTGLEGIIACYEKLGDLASVQKHMELRLERASFEWERARAMQELARFYGENGEMDEAARQIVQIEKTCTGRYVENAIRSSASAVPQEKRKDLAGALSRILKDNPELLYCKIRLVQLYMDAQDTSSANGVLSELIARTWDDPVLLRKVGEAISYNPAFGNQAIKIYSRLVHLQPSVGEHLVTLAQVYSNAGLKSQAVELAQRILRGYRENIYRRETGRGMDPGYAASAVGDIFARFEMWAEALDAYNLALELRPESWEDYESSMAQVFERRGEVEKATAIYKRIAKESQEDYRRENALYQLVTLHERRDEKDLAVKYLRQIMAMSKSQSEKENIQRRIDRLTAQTEKPNAPAPAN